MSQKLKKVLVAFNRGIVSKLGMARLDVERLALSAETQINWIPRVLGSMMLRVGFGHIASTKNAGAGRLLPFQFTFSDTAQLEMTDNLMRVWKDDVLVERPGVSSSVTNGSFTSNISNWTDADETGGTSSWLTGGYLALIGDGTDSAIRRQTISVSLSNQAILHSLRIKIERGPVRFRVGTAAGLEDILVEQVLGTGEHSIAFTPNATSFSIQFASAESYTVLVDSCEMEAAGVLEIETPYAVGDDLDCIRKSQSGDVIYVHCRGKQQRKIERRDNDSWSLVLFEPTNGPFRVQNVTKLTLAPSAIVGDITLTASKSYFKSGHVGGLFRIASKGQTVTVSISAENTFSDPIRVTGTGDGRTFSIVLTGLTGTGNNVVIQYSNSEDGPWIDSSSTPPFFADTVTTKNDQQDDQILYWRIGIKTGDYSSGTTVATLSYAAGSITGVARVTGFTSDTVVDAVVLDAFGSVDPSEDWWEAAWSDYRGWPGAGAIFEGRLWHAGRDKIWGSESDLYESYDDQVEGDAGTISRTIGQGPIQDVHWMIALSRLLFGTVDNSANVEAMEINGNNVLAGISNSFEEPLTPTNFNIKRTSPKGVFVDRSGQRLYELTFRSDFTSVDDYGSGDLSVMTPDLNAAGIIRLGVQHKPDLRIHCVRADGTVGLLVFDPAENVMCWVEVETDGLVEDVSILPGTTEDQVYYIINRTIAGQQYRYIEKWALESECQGGDINKNIDSHVVYEGSPTTNIPVAHLEDKTVQIWADGKDVGTKVVSGGAITLDEAATSVVVGLAYTAKFKSSKLGAIDQLGLNEKQIIKAMGLTLRNTHYLGLQYGPNFNELDDMPLVSKTGMTWEADTILEDYEDELVPFNGEWTTDARLHLQAASPRPATVLACTMNLLQSER